MPTRYEMVMVDRMSGPAKTALDAVWKLDMKVQGLAKSLRTTLKSAVTDAKGVMKGLDGKATASLFQGTRGAFGRGANSMGLGSLGTGAIGWGSVVAGATAAAVAIGGISYALGRNVVEMAAFRESTLSSLETVMGSSEAAGRTFRNAMTIAGQTPLDTSDVVSMADNFAVAGFNENQLEPLIAAASDISAARGRVAADGFALVVSQMHAADKMDRGDLRQLLNAGVNTGAVLDSIANQMNIRGATERARRQAVLKAITDGRVTGDIGITAAMTAINARMDGGGELGTYARRRSETLVGALSNAKNAWDNLLMGMRTEDSPGLRSMTRMVLAVTEAMSANGPLGTELKGFVTDFTNVMGAGLFGDDPRGIIEIVTVGIRNLRPAVMDTLGGVIAFGRGFILGFRYFLDPLMELVGQLGDGGDSAGKWERFGVVFGNVAGIVVDGIAFMVGSFSLFGTWIEWFATVPGQMVEGFVTELRSDWGQITGAMEELASGLPTPVRNALGIRSPSRVMMELGAHTAEGFRLGVEGGSGNVAAAMAGLANAPALAGAVGGSGNGGGNIYLTVQVEAHPGTDGAAVGQAAGAAIIRQLADVLGLLNQGPALAPG